MSPSGTALSPNDLVGDAIEKTMRGVRRWEPAERSLFDHLTGVINSSLYNEIRKAASRSVIPIDEAILEGIKSDALSPEDEAAHKSDVTALLNFVKARDPEVSEMLSAILSFGVESTRDIAELLGMPIRDVYLKRQRLRRLFREYSMQSSAVQASEQGQNLAAEAGSPPHAPR